MPVTVLQPDGCRPIRIPLSLRDIHRPGPKKEGALVCSKGTNLDPAQQSSAGLLPLGKGGQTISLRRFHRLTSVCFAATSFPRKEANDQRLCRRWKPNDSTPKSRN